MSYRSMTGLKQFFSWGTRCGRRVLIHNRETTALYFRIGVHILVFLEIGIDMFLESSRQTPFRNDTYWGMGMVLADILYKLSYPPPPSRFNLLHCPGPCGTKFRVSGPLAVVRLTPLHYGGLSTYNIVPPLLNLCSRILFCLMHKNASFVFSASLNLYEVQAVHSLHLICKSACGTHLPEDLLKSWSTFTYIWRKWRTWK